MHSVRLRMRSVTSLYGFAFITQADATGLRIAQGYGSYYS
jgi:hypothetical protein